MRIKCPKCGSKLFRLEQTIEGLDVICHKCREKLLGMKRTIQQQTPYDQQLYV